MNKTIFSILSAKPPNLKSYLFNTSWVFLGQSFQMGIGFVVGIFVARYLKPSGYGVLNYAQSLVSIFGVVSVLGIRDILTRDIINNKTKTEEILGTAFLIRLGGSVLELLLIYLTLLLLHQSPYINAIIFIIALSSIFQSAKVTTFYFQSKVQMKYPVIAGICSTTLSAAMKILFILLHEPLIYFALAILFENFALGSILLGVYHLHGQTIFRWKFNKTIASKLLKDSWPLIISGTAGMIYTRIDQVMLKLLLSSSAVGLYAVAVKLSELWYIIPSAITTSLFPALLNARLQNKALYHRRLQTLYGLIIWIFIPLSVIVTFIGPWVVTLLYGSHYKQSGFLLAVYMWSGVFMGISFVTGRWFVAENKLIYSTVITIIGAAINVGLNVVLIENLGVYGAAIATIIAYIFANYICLAFIKGTREAFVNINRGFLLPFFMLLGPRKEKE